MPPGTKPPPFDWNKWLKTKNYKGRGVDLPGINALPKARYRGLPGINELTGADKPYTGLDSINKDGERHTAGQPKYAPTGVAGNLNGGGNTLGGGSSSVGSAGLPIPDPLATGNAQIDSIYAKLLDSLKGSNTDTAALHDAARKAIEKDFGESAKSMYDTYQGSRAAVDNSAKGLGIDLNTSKIGQEWDANLRKIADQSNSNLDTNLAYVEKMRALRGSQFEQLQAEAVTEQANKKAQLALELFNASQGGSSGGGGKSGSGGGRSRSGGGSSSSGKVTEKATDTQTVMNVGDTEALASLASNPSAQALFDQQYSLAGGDVTGAISGLQAIIDAAAKQATRPKKNKWMPGSVPLQKLTGAKKLADAKAAKAAMMKISGMYGNPGGKQTVTSSSTRKK